MKKKAIRVLILIITIFFFWILILYLDKVNKIEEVEIVPIKEAATVEEKKVDIERETQQPKPKAELNEADQVQEKQAEEEPAVEELRQVEMTYYLATGNPCANGEYPQEGMVAYSSQYIGCSVEIYTLDNELIGTYRITDTGYGRAEANGRGTIQNGNCIDIFMNSHEHGREFVRKYGTQVKIKIIEEE